MFLNKNPQQGVLQSMVLAAPLLIFCLLSFTFMASAQEMSAGAEIPEGMTAEEVEQVMVTMAKLDAEMSEDMIAAMDTVVQLKTGALIDGDAAHKGSGQATIFQLPDSSNLLRLENLNVTNGPDLHVILTAHADPQNSGDIKSGAYVDLGKLKGNKGNQNYPIPADVDVAAMQTVVIYCMPFHVVFSTASLQ